MNVKQVSENQFIAFVLALLITFTNAFECPEDCACWEVSDHQHTYNHAKCTTLNGLRESAKINELHSLDVSELSLKKVTDQFVKLTNLTIVNLHNNQLSEVKSLQNKRIKVLNLSMNEITSGKLLKLPISVMHLNLTKNEITYLPLEFKKYNDLRSLELADNPLNCSCETIQVREWLAEKDVVTGDVTCLSPIEYKGRSWLEVHLSEVCYERHSTPNNNLDDSNEMLADDPGVDVVENTPNQNADNNNGIEKEYIPVNLTNAKDNINDNIDEEGSGDDGDETTAVTKSLIDEDKEEELETKQPINETVSQYETKALFNGLSTEENSLATEQPDTDTATNATTEEVSDPDTNTETQTAASSPPVGKEDKSSDETSSEDNGSGTETTDTTTVTDTSTEPEVIGFNSDTNAAGAESNIDQQTEVPEERMLPVKILDTESEPVQTNGETNATSFSAPIKTDSTNGEHKVEEGNSTFILLGILAVLLVVLILYVATKRSKNAPKNRRNNNDVENPAQELLTMDKNNLGKPIQPNNGTEIIPLIGSKVPANKGNNLSNAQEPLLKRLTEEDEEEKSGSSSDGKDTTDAPNTPEADRSGSTAPHASPTSQKQVNDVQTTPAATPPVHNGVQSSPKENGDKDFQPTSPKSSSRYSPVC